MSKVYSFGAILFDQYDEFETLAGCSLNIAWHLKALEIPVSLVSRLGEDQLGQKALEKMGQWGLDCHYVNPHPQLPTGVVKVVLNAKKEALFESLAIAAFDEIEYDPNLAVDPRDCVYFDSYSIRGKNNQETLTNYLSKSSNIFVDLNLRQGHWNEISLKYCLHHATHLKVNEEELHICAEKFGLDTKHYEKSCHKIIEMFNLKTMWCTFGEHGAWAITKDKKLYTHCIKTKEKITNTVGAGDAFFAAQIFCLYHNVGFEKALKMGNILALKVCQAKGATLEDLPQYKELITTMGINT